MKKKSFYNSLKVMQYFKKSLIEYYDSMKDPIKLYYMDKM